MGLNLLVVDDSAAIRKILWRVLRQTDLLLGECFEAGDGREALAILRKETIGLVLTDINMPRMNGMHLLAEIKSDGDLLAIPVILITNEGAQAKRLGALQRGAAGYIRKPFTARQIQEQVKGILDVTAYRGPVGKAADFIIL